MTRIIWIFIGLNTAALLIAVIAFFVITNGKKIGYMEGGWSIILASVSVAVILLAALPLHFSQSTFSRIFSGFFAFLPFCIASGIFISNKLKASRQPGTFAEVYYTDPQQLAIANAIEKNDTVLLKQLIKGKDLSVTGSDELEYYRLNYLQFAIRIRSNPMSFPFDDQMNQLTIRLLIDSGSPATPALYEATQYLPLPLVGELLEAGADPNVENVNGYKNILFATMGSTKKENDAAILLIEHGAEVNRVNEEGLTVMMRAAKNAKTSETWTDAWRLIRYMLEKTNADTRIVSRDGETLQSIIKAIREEAKREEIVMCENFNNVFNKLNK
ncbi:MAG: ankyrin repeat domain-containing protein [Chitinophagaceae bacterium]|nr:MAG: ankyrin repeat domain-containing protein [Chitinophagaceae bacterium]